MTAISKTSVAAYFETGDRPTQAQFRDLIDSYLDFDLTLQAIASAAQDQGQTGVIVIESTGQATTRSLGAVGVQLVGAAATASAQQALGGGAVGRAVLEAVTTASAYSALGVGVANINDLTTDATPDPAADFVASYDTSASGHKKVLIGNLSGFKVGSFTRDVSLANSTQAVTGVGFKPRAVVFLANIASNAAASVGIDTQAAAGAIINNHNSTSNTWTNNNSSSIFIITGVGATYSGNIQSLDSDGFTVNWVKAGSPSGTATIFYLALR